MGDDRPSVSLPPDHDVYQGNLWGESGDARKTTQAAGGYDMAPERMNVVYRTQTAHHPDPHDPAPARRGAIQRVIIWSANVVAISGSSSLTQPLALRKLPSSACAGSRTRC
jgi:hypothetical protein